jgi:hypothetical protein
MNVQQDLIPLIVPIQHDFANQRADDSLFEASIRRWSVPHPGQILSQAAQSLHVRSWPRSCLGFEFDLSHLQLSDAPQSGLPAGLELTSHESFRGVDKRMAPLGE